MPRNFIHLDRLKRLTAQIRPHHLAMAAVVAAIGVGVAGLRAVPLPGPEPIREDDRIRIQVVDPVEPEIAPGSVMDVGDLVDGFVFTPPPQQVAEPVAMASHDEDFGPPPSRSLPGEYVGRAVIQAPPQPEAWPDDPRVPRDERAGRWFGFDSPERDYRGEREARRARRDARWERERERDWDQDRREARRYSSSGPWDRRD